MTIKKEEVVSLGIVLKTHPYKESDSLVTVYFKDYGNLEVTNCDFIAGMFILSETDLTDSIQ